MAECETQWLKRGTRSQRGTMSNIRGRLVFFFSIILLSVAQTEAGAAGGNAEKGKVLYVNLCSRCHGVEGRGDGVMKFTPPVADLTAPASQNKLDAALLKTIHEGRKNSAMGAWKFALSDEEIRDVTAYVRILGSGASSKLP